VLRGVSGWRRVSRLALKTLLCSIISNKIELDEMLIILPSCDPVGEDTFKTAKPHK
jgi:hypothetical protein